MRGALHFVMNLRVARSKYSTLRLLSSDGLSAASFAMPTSSGTPYIRLLFAICQVPDLACLQNDARISLAPRDAFAIQEFEQRNRVFAARAGPGFEVGNGEAGTFSRGEKSAQSGDGGGVENEVGGHANQLAIANQNLQERAGAGGVDARLRQNLGSGGNAETRSFKGIFELFEGLRFVALEGDVVGGEADEIAFDDDFAGGGGEHQIEQKRGRAGEFAAAQFLLLDAFSQGIFTVTIGKLSGELPESFELPPGVNQEIFLPYFFARESGARDEILGAHAEFRFGDQQCDSLRWSRGGEILEASVEGGAADARRRIDIDHDSAADGHDRREHTNDETVARQNQQRIAQQKSNVGARAGLDGVERGDQARFGFDFGGSRMKVNGRTMLQRVG